MQQCRKIDKKWDYYPVYQFLITNQPTSIDKRFPTLKMTEHVFIVQKIVVANRIVAIIEQRDREIVQINRTRNFRPSICFTHFINVRASKIPDIICCFQCKLYIVMNSLV